MPPDHPAERREGEQPEQREHGPVAGGAARRVDGRLRAVRPHAEEREQLEQRARPEPHQEAVAVGAERRRERDAPPPAAGEQVDRRDGERQQHRDQHELERPAADDPGAEVDVRRRALRQLEPLVERAEQALRGAAELGVAAAVQPVGRVARDRGRPLRQRRDRDGGDAAPDERRLLVEAEREAEIDELREAERPRRPAAALLRDPRRRRGDERGGGRARRARPRSRAAAGRRRRSRRG